MINLADEDELIPLADAAKRVRISRDRLQKLAEQGRITAHYVGEYPLPFFDPEDCDALRVELADERAEKATQEVQAAQSSSTETKHQDIRERALAQQAQGRERGKSIGELEREIRERRVQRIEQQRQSDLASVALAAGAVALMAWQLKQRQKDGK